ncbi:hypothetical protein N2152v2_010412 [Parachlorella kessleri]
MAAVCSVTRVGLAHGLAARPKFLQPSARSPLVMKQRRLHIVAFKEGEREPPESRAEKQSPGGSGYQPPDAPVMPAFTRGREHIVGRVAMAGFAANLLGEAVTGLGPISQIHAETGLPTIVIYALFLGFIGWFGIGGVSPDSPTWSEENQRDTNMRKPTPGINPLKEPGKRIARTELLLGRTAMLAFVGAAGVEALWGGQAPLVHVGLITPGSLAGQPWWLYAAVATLLVGSTGILSKAANPRQDTDAF